MAATTASSAPIAGAALDALLDRITVLKLQQKSIDAELSPLLEQLSGALEAGELDASFSHNGCSFCWSAGRTSYAYPEPLQQQEQLRQHKLVPIMDPLWTLYGPFMDPLWTPYGPFMDPLQIRTSTLPIVQQMGLMDPEYS